MKESGLGELEMPTVVSRSIGIESGTSAIWQFKYPSFYKKQKAPAALSFCRGE